MEVLPVSNVEYNSQEVCNYESYSFADENEVSRTVVDALAARLVEELKCAKKNHFSSGEVLLPYGLLQTVAKDVLQEAEMEPCGLRGCTLYLRFRGEDRAESDILLGTVKFDRTTASTFEITLCLKQSTAGWNFIPIPQFLKKMARGGTVMIDSDYKLEKNKLYRSFVE